MSWVVDAFASVSVSSTVEKTSCLWYWPNFLPPFLLSMSFSHYYKLDYENDDLMIENNLLIGFMRMTAGNPALRENMSCNYWWSPAWDHMKLTGLSLKLFTTPRTIYRYTDLYSCEESNMLGKNTTTHNGIDKSTQFYFHFVYDVNLSTRNPLFTLICYCAHSAIAFATLAPSYL